MGDEELEIKTGNFRHSPALKDNTGACFLYFSVRKMSKEKEASFEDCNGNLSGAASASKIVLDSNSNPLLVSRFLFSGTEKNAVKLTEPSKSRTSSSGRRLLNFGKYCGVREFIMNESILY